MSEEKRKGEDETSSVEIPRIEARPKNWLVPVILLTLREQDSYGYEMMERARAFGFEAMNPGTVYRTLRQMEKDGIVKSNWDIPKGGPARRMYSVTDVGEAYLDLWVESLEKYQRTINTFFRLYTIESPLQTSITGP